MPAQYSHQGVLLLWIDAGMSFVVNAKKTVTINATTNKIPTAMNVLPIRLLRLAFSAAMVGMPSPATSMSRI